ncbi:MAG: TadE/TadG family type IV pilus assembly protein [Pirellulales bacterium]
MRTQLNGSPAVASANDGRRGAAAVEFALVSPLLFLLCLGMLEFGRMMMVQEIVTNAAREGGRKAILPGVTDGDVASAVDSYFATCGISGHTISVLPSTTSAAAGTPIKVTASVPYNNVSWLPIGNLKWLQGKSVTAAVEMRKEEY